MPSYERHLAVDLAIDFYGILCILTVFLGVIGMVLVVHTGSLFLIVPYYILSHYLMFKFSSIYGGLGKEHIIVAMRNETLAKRH